MAIKYQGEGLGPKVVVLALLAVFAGLVYVFWGRIKDRLTEEEVLPSEAGPIVEKPAPVRPKPKPVKRRVAPRPKPKPVVRKQIGPSDDDRERAAEVRIQAEAAMLDLDFRTAAGLFSKEASILKLDRDASQEADDLATRAETFGMLLAKVKRNPETEGNLVIMRRHDGRKIEVALVGETDDSYIVAKRGNIRGEIPKIDIKEMSKVPQETHRARAREAFKRDEAKMTSNSGVSHYLLAQKAYQNGLDPEALKHLDVAYSKDGATLPTALERYQASQMLLRAMWCESTGRMSLAKMWCQRLKREFGSQDELVKDANDLLARMATTAVASYKATVKIKVREVASAKTNDEPVSSQDEKVTGVDVVEVKSRSVRNKAHIRQINSLFKDGMDHYIAGRPGSPDSNKHLAKAVALFDRVINLCDKALQNDPDNPELTSRQADAARYGYHARKMKTLSVGGG